MRRLFDFIMRGFGHRTGGLIAVALFTAVVAYFKA
jgi:TRAP-type C4-dicarboxylate transport system permease large subunit